MASPIITIHPAFRAHRHRSSLDQSRRLLEGPRLTDLGQNIGRQDTARFPLQRS